MADTVADPENVDVEAPPPAEQAEPVSKETAGLTESEAPPSYEASQPSEPPPSYESLYGKLKGAKQESGGVVDFFKAVTLIIMGTIGCTICLGLALAIPIAHIVIGAIYKDDCPYEDYIPIYLIVAGSVGCAKQLSSWFQQIRNKKQENQEQNAKANPFDCILGLFLIAWFIAGNVWVYSIKSDVDTDDKTSPKYCDGTVYYFAFWMITLTYIFAALGCICACCGAMFASKK